LFILTNLRRDGSMKILLAAVAVIMLAGVMVSEGCGQAAPPVQQEQPCSDNACGVEPPIAATPESKPSPSQLVPRITAEELYQKILHNEDMLIIDDRRGVETSYAEGHVKGAVSVPFDLILSREWTPPENKDLEIIIYCS
jgi:hypothetical protein